MAAETNFHRRLKVKVLEVLEARKDDVSSGVCKTFDHYKQDVGYMNGLQDALKLAEEVERELDQ